MRIGIIGGTFDPIHLGHLVLAERARDEVKLDQVIFLPAAIPPHKQDNTISASKHRLEMVELAIAGNPHFSASDLELKRSGVSYTVSTLRELHAVYDKVQLSLIVGSDTLHDIPNWREPGEVVRLADLIVGIRAGAPTGSPPIEGARVSWIEMPQLDISSTDLRRRVKEGRSIRYLVPASVDAYIAANMLYLPTT